MHRCTDFRKTNLNAFIYITIYFKKKSSATFDGNRHLPLPAVGIEHMALRPAMELSSRPPSRPPLLLLLLLLHGFAQQPHSGSCEARSVSFSNAVPRRTAAGDIIDSHSNVMVQVRP